MHNGGHRRRGRLKGSTIVLTRKVEMRGFVYVARDGDTIVQFASQDVTPETAKTLSLADAAVHTFKKNYSDRMQGALSANCGFLPACDTLARSAAGRSEKGSRPRDGVGFQTRAR